MNKGDVILICIFCATIAAFGLNEWNLIHGYEQLSGYQWQFLQALLAGELLFFALYKIGKHTSKAIVARRGGQVPERLEQEEQESKGENR